MAVASAEDRWIVSRMSEELLDRIGLVRRDFGAALILGHDFGAAAAKLRAMGSTVFVVDPGFAIASVTGGVQCDEDRLPIADGSIDLVLAVGTLDTVNDLPGALVLIRRVLRPGGLFMAALAGAGSLAVLRAAIDDGVARFHPQIDVRAAGDLLGRAGFALPVADMDTLSARYRNAERLFDDLRANGLRNVLAGRHTLSRQRLAAIRRHFQNATEQFGILYLTGWAPEARPSVPGHR